MNLKANINSFFSFNNVNLFFVMSIAFLMPFHKYTPELTIYWFIIWLFERNYLKKDNYLPKANKIVFFSLMLYFLYMVLELPLFNFALIELKHLESRSCFLIFPLIFMFSNDKIKENIDKILFLFTVSCTIVSLKKIIFEGMIQGLTYIDFAGINPTWFSLYNSFAVAINFYLFYKNKKNIASVSLYLIANAILIIAMYLAASRAGIVSLTIILVLQFFWLVKKYKKTKFIGLAILIITLIFVIKQPRMSEIKNESGTIRIYLNLVGLRVLKENCKSPMKFLFGIGEIETKRVFVKFLQEETRISEGARSYLDTSHNTFITTFIRRGFIGFSLLITFFFLPFYYFAKKNRLFLSFMIIMVVNQLLNGIFGLRVGSYFFSFFYCLLILQSAILHKEIGVDEEI